MELRPHSVYGARDWALQKTAAARDQLEAQHAGPEVKFLDKRVIGELNAIKGGESASQ